MGQVGSTTVLSLLFGSLLFASLIPILYPAFAQEEQVVNRRVEIWALFYRLMTAAFIVGAVVQGTMVYIAVKFNEKKVKHKEVSR